MEPLALPLLNTLENFETTPSPFTHHILSVPKSEPKLDGPARDSAPSGGKSRKGEARGRWASARWQYGPREACHLVEGRDSQEASPEMQDTDPPKGNTVNKAK